LGALDAAAARRVVAAGGDVAMVIDRHGVIRDMAVSNEAMVRQGAASWLDRRWSDTVTSDSRHKVDELIREAQTKGGTRWREVNQITEDESSLMVRYVAVDAGHDGHIIAIGRDDRATEAMQQRLLDAQQTMERDYSRLRDAEFRYRLLFQTSSEAVIIVDGATKRILQANPAAEAFIGGRMPLVGEAFTKIFAPSSHDAAAALLAVVQSSPRINGSESRLVANDQEFIVSASLFRQDRASQFLVRLSQAGESGRCDADVGRATQEVMERVPDAFLVTDEQLKIVSANSAFLDLVRVASPEQAAGMPLTRFLGRAGLERNILLDNLRAHGSVRNFATVLRNQLGEQDDVEVSAVLAPEAGEVYCGFTIRMVGRRASDRSPTSPELHRSVEKLTELVGKVTLKELVSETTDLVERLCIEAALDLTKNNRASAAEVLGLSRQSLYSKLHRFGLGNLGGGEGSSSE